MIFLNYNIFCIGPYGHSDFFDRQQGLLTPWSHVPHMALTYTDKMSFTERWYNTVLSAADWIVRRWITVPGHEALAKKYFGHLGDLPTIDELHKNVSIIFENNHRSLAPPRPSLPNIIEIGGSHVKPPKALPNDIKTFLDGAKDGAIYMSFGTVMQSSEMPKEIIAAFISKFIVSLKLTKMGSDFINWLSFFIQQKHFHKSNKESYGNLKMNH